MQSPIVEVAGLDLNFVDVTNAVTTMPNLPPR